MSQAHESLAEILNQFAAELSHVSAHADASQEKQALRECIGVTEQEHLAQKTWRDALAWKTLRSLITAHLKAVTSIKTEIETLALVVDISLDSGAFEHVMGELEDMREVLSEFESRGRDISDLVSELSFERELDLSHLRTCRCTTSSAFETQR